jgi:hypothetical protein
MVSIFMGVSLVVVGEERSLAGVDPDGDGAGHGNGRKKNAGWCAAAFR